MRSWLYLFWGSMLAPILFRFLSAASLLSIAEPLQGRLDKGLFFVMILAFYGSLAAVSWRAQAKSFTHLSPLQAKYLKRLGLIMGFVVLASFTIDFANNFFPLESAAAGFLSILPSFLFMAVCLAFMNRFVAVMFPHLDARKTREEKFQSLIKEFGISNREREILLLVCQGKTNKEIEETLFISLPTVKDHVSNIFRKTGVTNRVQLAALFHFMPDH